MRDITKGIAAPKNGSPQEYLFVLLKQQYKQRAKTGLCTAMHYCALELMRIEWIII